MRDRGSDCMHCPCSASMIRDFSPPAIQLLESSRRTHAFKKRQLLYYEDSEATGAFCIKSGQVKVYKTGPDGKQSILRIVGPGKLLGIEAVFREGPHRTSAEMITEGTICFIPKQTWLDIVKKDSTVALDFLKLLSETILESDNERVELAQGNVRERLAYLLTALSQSHGHKIKQGIEITTAFSREELAEMVGTAVATTIRLLKEFRDDQLIALHGKNIVILNQQKLMKTANF